MITFNFKDKTAIVTGAGGGFGRSTARMLAQCGARIVGVDRNAQSLAETMAALPAIGGGHLTIVQDLRPARAANDVIAKAMEHLPHLDILVNSAGVCHFTPANKVTPEQWDEVMEIDLKSLYFLAVAAAEAMDPQRGGRIINLGSNAGRKGRAFSAHYAAAKAGVANVTESLALAYGKKGITINTVCPAVVLTDMWQQNFEELGHITGKSADDLVQNWIAATPLQRLGTVEDVANLITFLASDGAGFITGQEINVCGGFMLTC
jgi:NAD(P)-dependent dehydrogenase (short-subunit alcohol dehydrogenase family)